MFCRKCGMQIEEEVRICPKCGALQNNVVYVEPAKSYFGEALLGFLFPLIGLIFYLVWKNDKPKRASACGKGALISVLISVIVPLLISCVGIIMAPGMV